MKRIRKLLPLLFPVVILLLASCARSDVELPPEPEEGVLIYAALNPVKRPLQNSVKRFNEKHTDVQIEIRDYSDKGGIERLKVEMMAGRVPDIIEMHGFGKKGEQWFFDPFVDFASPPEDEYFMPYRQMVQQGYLEDLWPYIENDPELGRNGVLEAPLKAAEVNGGLYMLFGQVRICTLVGARRAVGDRYSWTVEDVLEALSTMPPDSTVLQYNLTQRDIFARLLSYSLNHYVDWEAGTTSFDSESFRNMLAFLQLFPSEFKTSLTLDQMEKEIAWRKVDDMQMLEAVVINMLWEITAYDALWGEPVSYVGFPMESGSSGSIYKLQGRVLAMSSGCRNKEAAWEYMRSLVKSKQTYAGLLQMRLYGEFAGGENTSIFINKKDYDLANHAELELSKGVDNGKLLRYGWDHVWGYPTNNPVYPRRANPQLERPHEEDLVRFETLINATTMIYWPDDALADVVWDAIGPYLAGDRDLDETIRLLDNRVRLYVNELR